MKPNLAVLTTFLTTLFLQAPGQSSGQSEKKRIEASAFRGQIMIYSDASLTDPEKPDTWYMNLGGPSLRFQSGKYSLGAYFAPTMRMDVLYEGPQFAPVVGFGAELGYKRFLFSVCEFYRTRPAPKKNIWEMAVGVGYRLGK